MELPKNITQIGEADKNCKIYVEDYVVSYMKQLNRQAEDKPVTIAIYGRCSREQSLTYCFVYGACLMTSLQKEVRHLSQAQLQEVEKQRKKYFADYDFLGYQILNGEMVEGFYIREQDSCRYIKGYACFYEKNDSMLAYMLDNRTEEHQPEEFGQEKYEKARQRQEERRQQYEGQETAGGGNRSKMVRMSKEKTAGVKPPGVKLSGVKSPREKTSAEKTPAENVGSVKLMRVASVAMFALLCLAAVASFRAGEGGNLGDSVRQLFADLGTQRLPNEDAVAVMGSDVTSTLVAEDSLTEAMQRENAAGQQLEESQPDETLPSEEDLSSEQMPAQAENMEPSGEDHPSGESQPSEESQAPDAAQAAETGSTQQTYIIQPGDTLIGISTRIYGNDSYVNAICELNSIVNPDNIQTGQKIILP